MKKIILISLTTTLLLFTIIFAWAFIAHLTLPYNDEGRYFDEDSMTVYKQQSVLVYGIVAVVAFVLTTLTGMSTKKMLADKKLTKRK